MYSRKSEFDQERTGVVKLSFKRITTARRRRNGLDVNERREVRSDNAVNVRYIYVLCVNDVNKLIDVGYFCAILEQVVRLFLHVSRYIRVH